MAREHGPSQPRRHYTLLSDSIVEAHSWRAVKWVAVLGSVQADTPSGSLAHYSTIALLFHELLGSMFDLMTHWQLAARADRDVS